MQNMTMKNLLFVFCLLMVVMQATATLHRKSLGRKNRIVKMVKRSLYNRIEDQDIEALEKRLLELLSNNKADEELSERAKPPGAGAMVKGNGNHPPPPSPYPPHTSSAPWSGESEEFHTAAPFESNETESSGSSEESSGEGSGYYYDAMYGYQEQLIQFYKDQCGVDLAGHFNKDGPVTPGEINEAMADFLPEVQTFNVNMNGHVSTIQEIESFLESADFSDPSTLESSVDQHRDLVSEFLESLENAADPILCSLAKSIPLKLRVAIYGTTGFRRSACYQLSDLMWSHWNSHASPEELAMSLTEEGLHELTQALRDTISCIITKSGDLESLVERASNINGDMTDKKAFDLMSEVDWYMDTLHKESYGLMWDVNELATLVELRSQMIEQTREIADTETQEVLDMKRRLAMLLGSLQQLADNKKNRNK